MINFHRNPVWHKALSVCLGLLFLVAGTGAAQCPANIGFEDGSFSNWQCASGTVDSNALVTVAPSAPLPGIHTLLQNAYPQQTDLYGRFPVNCPNGSRYSIKLGNDRPSSQAHRASYTFTVPAGQNLYSLIYNYAVVLQNPDHLPAQQPRFTAKVFDVTGNTYVDCSSFDFAASSSLPGFQQSEVLPSVYYKPWSPVTIKLMNLAGKTLRLEFTVHDCTIGGHFGYAYIDVNEDCTAPIQGNIYCLGAASIRLTAPYGFREYRWYNAGFTTLLGTGNTLSFSPPPPAGTVYALEVIPFPGSGCKDTLYTTTVYAPVPFVLQVKDTIGSCPPTYPDLTVPEIKTGSSPGLRYTYFADANLMQYVPIPWMINRAGRYYVKATHPSGCIDARPIQVVLDSLPKMTVSNPLATIDTNAVDITDPALISNVNGLFAYSYWQDVAATVPLPDPEAVRRSGTYYIRAVNSSGCSVVKPVVVTLLPRYRNHQPNVFSPNGDGIHDTWEITGLHFYTRCDLTVFSRYGEPVFHSTGYQTPWDGRRNGRPLPVGTYYYVLRLYPQGPPVTGSVTIVR